MIQCWKEWFNNKRGRSNSTPWGAYTKIFSCARSSYRGSCVDPLSAGYLKGLSMWLHNFSVIFFFKLRQSHFVYKDGILSILKFQSIFWAQPDLKWLCKLQDVPWDSWALLLFALRHPRGFWCHLSSVTPHSEPTCSNNSVISSSWNKEVKRAHCPLSASLCHCPIPPQYFFPSVSGQCHLTFGGQN